MAGDGDDGLFSITLPPIFRRPALHVTHPGTLLLTRPFMPVNPLEELHRSMLLGMGAPDIFFGDEDEDENDDPFEAMLNEAHGLFGLFGDPLVHRGLGRGIDLSRRPTARCRSRCACTRSTPHRSACASMRGRACA